MRLVQHGAGCCGIRHIFGMGSSPEGNHETCTYQGAEVDRGDTSGAATLTALLERQILAYPAGGRLLEVVVTDGQQTRWGPELTRQGFRRVVRFLNYNTHHWCNIWHHYDHPENYEVFEANQPNAPVAHRPLRVGDRVRHTGNEAHNIGPMPQLGIGTVQNAAEIANIRVLWGGDGGRGDRGHFAESLTLVEEAVPEAPNNPDVFEQDGVLYSVAAIHRDGSLNAHSEQRQNFSFNIIRSDEYRRLLQLREERRHILSTYHCEYRDGRRGAGYDTREAAQTANPRARSIVEKRIYSDGTTDFVIGD